MRKSRFSEAQIVSILKEADAGMKVADVCRKHGVSEPTYYKWKSRYGGLEASELKLTVRRSDKAKGFEVLPQRWIVERTFSWLIQSRRLIRDHEVLMEHSKALIHLSMSRRMLARIAA